MISKNENIYISKLLGRVVIYLNKNNVIYNAINLFAEKNIGALQVVKNKKTLCGIISKKDVILELASDIKKNIKTYLMSTIMNSKGHNMQKYTKSDRLMDIM